MLKLTFPPLSRFGLGISCAVSLCGGVSAFSLPAVAVTQNVPQNQQRDGNRQIPSPLPNHPGNIFLEDEAVVVRFPTNVPPDAGGWRLSNDREQAVRDGRAPREALTKAEPLDLGNLDPGWYRLDLVTTGATPHAWTTLAVLPRLQVPTPLDSPIAVDTAAAWFARDNVNKQAALANLAALAGVNWVRDRLRWNDIQPVPGELKPGPTTYDTSARVHAEAGLRVLQVFHDTPRWAAEGPNATGRFAPDLRRAYEFCRALAGRFKGTVAAWEPWNEANISMFGGHTVDQMCSWQKAAWLGFKAADPQVIVGWNVTAAIPTPAHAHGVIANETWPYYDTYNIHTYDWPHAYPELWKPVWEATAGRPLWITEADRGTPHMKDPPWYDQEPRLERLKAEWMAQAFALSLFSGSSCHFHFILGNYQEQDRIQFGLLRQDLTPRPAYVALAAIGRCLAGARALGRWLPGQNARVYAFRARPDGQERDVLVAWAEKEADWDERGKTTADWALPIGVAPEKVIDYLGRTIKLPSRLTSAPLFVLLPPGQAEKLPLQPATQHPAWRPGDASPVVLQLSWPRSAVTRVEDVKWSEGFAYAAKPGETMQFKLYGYNLGTNNAAGRLRFASQPARWETVLETTEFSAAPMERSELGGSLRIPAGASVRDGWVVLTADCGRNGSPALAFRVIAKQ